jgi:GNAT superfamily N-acetyltransferase
VRHFLFLHRSVFIDLQEEYINWIASELKINIDFDLFSMLEIPLREYVENTLEEYASYNPPNGIFYLLRINKEIVGMGALRKLRKEIGEIKRMYIQPKHRGIGYGKEMLELLLNKAKEFGFSVIYLDSGSFMKTAHHLYRSMGFYDREAYPESELPPQVHHFWVFMEKQI